MKRFVGKWTLQKRGRSTTSCTASDHKLNDERVNAMNIQMLNDFMYKQLFPRQSDHHPRDKDAIKGCIDGLKKFKLWNQQENLVTTPKFELPKLLGGNIDEHFKMISEKMNMGCVMKLKHLANCKQLPVMPKMWSKTTGWTKYSNKNNRIIGEKVDYPDANAMIFDCEVLVRSSDDPVIAVAVSADNWYSWTSKAVFGKPRIGEKVLEYLIPLESGQKNSSTNSEEKVVIGHNISYDRARVKEQFYFNEDKVKFLDTMSMHIAIGGLITNQQNIAISHKKVAKTLGDSENDLSQEKWQKFGSLNNLSDVHKLYCGTSLNKDARNIFVKGSMKDLKDNFQDLMTYCANDVHGTHDIFRKMWPLFNERFPHPVTLCGALEMGKMFLPITSNWNRYIDSCEHIHHDLMNELTGKLSLLAKENCYKHTNYFNDNWVWDLDWTVQDIKFLKNPKKVENPETWFNSTPITTVSNQIVLDAVEMQFLGKSNAVEFQASSQLETILSMTYAQLSKIDKHMPGYPLWYRELCLKESRNDWQPGPVELSPLKRIVPKLLNITWKGFPLHYVANCGWGYLVDKNYNVSSPEILEEDDNENEEDNRNLMKYTTDGVCVDDIPDLPENKSYFKIPHKDGKASNVGGLFSKGMLSYVEKGLISSANKEDALRCLHINMSISYWRSARDRVLSQVLMYHKTENLPNSIKSSPDFDKNLKYGAIIPIVAVSGTVTRRAVERTWLTASNVRSERIGSELKSMVHAPPGYCFVGADVDSQELWIASLFSDTMSAHEHGCSPISWMTLQGQKSCGTDMHSKTAEAIGISRDQAKAFNYARIYGGGKNLALNMMKSFNPNLSSSQALKKVNTLYDITKGDICYMLSLEGRWYAKQLGLRDLFRKDLLGVPLNKKEIYKLLKAVRTNYGHLNDVKIGNITSGNRYIGGMESDMFNKLAQIADSESPTTPVLNCRMSRALEPDKNDGKYITTRMNWVVQSSAVDYLHLLLVCMKWLIGEYNIDARLAISIHDELRYLSHEKDKYKTALALQISNLLTRCMFSYNVGMEDLPQSVAFFSSIEVDKALRKEANDDCITISNPNGLKHTYGIPSGETLTIHEILEKTKNGSFLLNK